MNTSRILSVLIIMLGTLVAEHALALTKTTSQSGNWSSTATWGGTPAPVAGDDVIINGGFVVTVDLPDAACQSVQLGGSVLNAGTGTLLFSSGSTLTVSGPVSIGPFNSNTTEGSLTMAAGGTLRCESIAVGRLGTWTAGTGTIEFTATNTIPSDNNVAFNNLRVSAGTTSLSRNLTVSGDLAIASGGALVCGANTLSLNGNWINDGVFTGSTGTVIFTRNGNQTISGTGTNNFNLLRVDMGATIANTLEVVSSHFNAPDGFLTITNGTFKMSGTFTFANTFILGPIYNIQPTSGLWINNPNVTVTPQAGGISVRGLFRITAGTYNVGTASGHSIDYVAGSTFLIEGGELHVAGRVGRNNAQATTSYTQTGGTVTVVEHGSTDPVFAGFDLGNVGSSFAMSGGTIVIRNATSAPADYLNIASLSTVTGGTLQVGDAASSSAQIIRIQSTRPVGAILVSGATPQAVKPVAQLVTSSLTIAGGVGIEAGTVLDAGGLNLSIGGNWTNDGTFTGGNGITFNGTGTQTITRNGGETLPNVTIAKSGGSLVLSDPLIVNGAFSLSVGTLDVGSSSLTLNGPVSGAGTLTSAATGTATYALGSPGQAVLAGTYGNLLFNNAAKTLPATGTILVAGTFSPGSATGHTTAGSTMEFNGSVQTIPPFEYFNLTASGTGSRTTAGTVTVNGSLTNGTGILFTAGDSLILAGSSHTNSGTLNVGTLSIPSGAVLTNNGTTAVTTRLTGAGSLIQGTGSSLAIAGTTTIATLEASASGNTVNYSGNSQSIAPTPYNHLALSGSGTPALSGVSVINGNFDISGSVTAAATTAMTIGGNLTTGSGATLNAASFSHTVRGNWSNAGTFIAGTSTISFAGTSPQTITGTTFSGLSVANSAGATMLGDVQVSGSLTLTTGALGIGTHTLTIDGPVAVGGGSIEGGTTSHLVIGGTGTPANLPAMSLGSLQMNRQGPVSLSGDISIASALVVNQGSLSTGTNAVILAQGATITEASGHPVVGIVRTTRAISATSGTEEFGGIGADMILHGVAPGTTTVMRTTCSASIGGGHQSIKRYFDISPSTTTGLLADLVFHYDSTELNTQNPATLELYRSRNNGTDWNNIGGIVNVASREVTIGGVSDFSRWTAADTSNRLGNAPTPVAALLDPASLVIGTPGFTLVVSGTEFIAGKSVVRFNGQPRTTTYVNATELSALIPATDLLVAGTFPVTVLTSDGGGISNPLMFTVTARPAVKVRVETAPDGSGTVVPSQSITSGSSITVYAISRDTLDNFVDNVPADSWVLENVTGGIVSGDLVPASDNKSAVFTAHVTGSATIKAPSGVLAPTSSGTVTVTAGNAVNVRVETAADGSGIVVPADSLASGSSITVYAVTRDASGNFVANAAADAWSLASITGGVVQGDLVAAPDARSATFTGHAEGSAVIVATSGALGTTTSGTITVRIQTGIAEGSLPTSYTLQQNYPNPFNPSTRIDFDMPQGGRVSLVIYDVTGRKVAELADDQREAGHYSIEWNAANLTSGTYFARYTAEDGQGQVKFTGVKKLVLLK